MKAKLSFVKRFTNLKEVAKLEIKRVVIQATIENVKIAKNLLTMFFVLARKTPKARIKLANIERG